MQRDRLANYRDAPDTVKAELKAALGGDDAVAVADAVCGVLARHWDDRTHFLARRARAGLAIAAMQAIDTALLAVHPGSATPPTSYALSAWLEDAREERTLFGHYARTDSLALIAKSPFARSARGPLETATFLLGDQFVALKVIDLATFNEDGRPLSITIKVIDQGVDRGVPRRADRKGSEVVSFAPLAETGGDLNATVTRDAGTYFLDIVKGTGFDPARRFMTAVDECADSDIFIAPELTMAPQDVADIADALSQRTGKSPRLLVTGSGLVPCADSESGFPYNQASIVNGQGALLWHHRKVSAYGMQKETSDGLDIPGGAGAAQLMERISWSNDITIGDVDGMGRFLVLICQDLMMEVVQRLLEAFRPDWVIVPILDTGTALGRWPARRARDLASATEARFLVVSSLAMKDWAKVDYPGDTMGVAVGPAYINLGDRGIDDAAQETQVAPESTVRRHGTVRWRAATGWRPYR